MTAVDRPDNGQDGFSDGTVLWGPVVWDGQRAMRFGVSSNTTLAASARAGAGEQQREAISALLREHWRTPTSACTCGGVQLGQDWTLHVADELLALLAHTDEETPPACLSRSHGVDGWHCAVEGPHDIHTNADGDASW